VIAQSAFLAFAIAPAIASAQVTIAPPPPAEPPPLHLFQAGPPTSTSDWISQHSADLWKPPVSGSDLPRWTIGRTATFRGPRGVAFSTGFTGRSGDPLPLYLSQSPLFQSIPGNSIVGPGSYRTQWDVTFRATAPIATVGRVKFKAFGDVIVPVMRRDSTNPAERLLNSPTICLGIMAVF
jgi:hypothetical protein